MAYEVRCDCTGCAACASHGCSIEQFGTCGRAAIDYGNASRVRATLRIHQGWKVNGPGGKDACDDCPKPAADAASTTTGEGVG